MIRTAHGKMLRCLFMLSAVCAAAGMTAFSASAEDGTAAGWYEADGKRHYALADGSDAVGAVAIGQNTYVFAPNGVQQTGWQTVNAHRYYYDPQSGEPVFGFLEWRGEQYYITQETGKAESLAQTPYGTVLADEQGVLQTGWQETGGDTYYFADNHLAVGGLKTIDNATYYFLNDGKMQRGVQNIGGSYYCFSEDGSLYSGWYDGEAGREYYGADGRRVTGLQNIDGKSYLFSDDGVLLLGKQEIDGKIYRYDACGVPYTGWFISEDGKEYYGADGSRCTGMQTIDGEMYCFSEDGIMQTGIVETDDGTYRFAEKTGAAVKGWYEDSDGREYYSEDGLQIHGMTVLDGKTYFFEENGRMRTGWLKAETGRYYFDEAGAMLTGDQEIDGHEYHFTAEGKDTDIRITLDAGHYGKYNHSPVNSAYWESDFTWKFHLILKEELEAYGIDVITTREDKDTDMALEDRGRVSAGSDLFLSLHSNAGPSSYSDGPLACCTVTEAVNDLGLQLANCVASVMQTNQGGSIWNRMGNHDRDYYGVLRGAAYVDTPGILLEHSYHTNYRATVWLMNDENLRKMAKEEAAVLAAYFGLTFP